MNVNYSFTEAYRGVSKKAQSSHKACIAKSYLKNVNTYSFCLKHDEAYHGSGGLERKKLTESDERFLKERPRHTFWFDITRAFTLCICPTTDPIWTKG